MNFRRHRHPANISRIDDATFGQRAADTVAGFMGSWKFVWIQTAIIVVWIALNVVDVAGQFDPYPFILLNLLFSTQAAYASPLILLAANRSAEHDRQRAEFDYHVNVEALDILKRLETHMEPREDSAHN